MRIVALGDRTPAYLTHRKIDATVALLAGAVDIGWVATDGAQATRFSRRWGRARPAPCTR